jgi:hypothetical protein
MKVKWGALMTDGRGKIGGHVASKNRGGAYLRTKVTPVNPQTSFQNTARNRVTTLSQAWRGLTATQQAAWNSAVSNWQKTDIFGDLKSPSGINLYVRLNANLSQIGVAAIATPPSPNTVVGPVTLALTATAGTPSLSLVYTATPVPAATTWIVRMTPQVSAGKSFVKSLFRNLTTIAPAGASPDNLLASYNTRFGTLVAGEKIFVEVIAISNTTGVKSTPVSTFVVVAA